MKQKKPVPPTSEELRAEAAVNELLGTRRTDYDDQTENGKVDFLLDPPEGGAGPTVALEVSSTTEPSRERLWDSLDSRYDQPIPGLQGDWIVQFTPGTRLNKAAAPLAALLVRLEQAGRDRIGLQVWDDSTAPGELHTPQHAADLQELASLRIVSAQRVRSDKASGRIFPTEATAGIARSTVDTISPYVDEFLESPQGRNKVEKLAKAL
ncbi:hypothetical protein [Streptomyces sp. NBC_01565]|uniref:hypothetical protein n=1 Tax=unclassified Streptomyces TaxID=2593676 RepID=UPI00224ED3E5|nr:hypothetical protein [Streptomyces sp. NBC_01565]MCX4546757.1 hypothetical protein [Streptomyces sp. NBC_01565]